jgi:predicted MFS family arabinose efflux permease
VTARFVADIPSPTSVPIVGERPARSPTFYFLTLVLFVSAFNMADRLLIGILAEPIKQEFGLTDTMMGLLSGTVFALVYPPLGLPIAALADRLNRKNILSACLAFWSAATAAAAAAGGYWQLVAARLAVAAGEAGFVPPTHSLIADYVSEKRRARAFSVIAAGAAVGMLVANIAGGALAETYGWRTAFALLGAGGCVLALVLAVTLREPPRSAPLTPKASVKRTGVRALLSNRVFMFCVLGSAFHLMYQYAAAAWSAPFYIRAFELNLLQAGLFVGIGGAVATALGGIAGGFAGDWFAARDRRWLAFWPAITVAVAAPFGAMGYLVGDVWLAFGSLLIAAFANALYQSSTYALVQSQVGGDGRATAAALMIFIQNLLGLGVGPLAVGVLSDQLTPEFGARALGIAMSGANALNIVAALLFVAAGLAIARGSVSEPRGA